MLRKVKMIVEKTAEKKAEGKVKQQAAKNKQDGKPKSIAKIVTKSA